MQIIQVSSNRISAAVVLDVTLDPRVIYLPKWLVTLTLFLATANFYQHVAGWQIPIVVVIPETVESLVIPKFSFIKNLPGHRLLRNEAVPTLYVRVYKRCRKRCKCIAP